MSAKTISALAIERALAFSEPRAAARVTHRIATLTGEFDAMHLAQGIALFSLMSALGAKETRPEHMPKREREALLNIATLMREAAQAFEEAAK